MAQVLYKADTGAAAFTSTAAVQTVIAIVNAATDCGIQLKKYRIGFAGVTASNPPVEVRLFSTGNTTAGTSTAGSIQRVAGLNIVTTNLSVGQQYTVEPTTKTYLDEFLLTPNGGTVIYDIPLGDEFDVGISSTIGMEITASVAVGVSACLFFCRI